MKGQPIEELSKMIVADVEATVEEVQKKVGKLSIEIPDIKKQWRTPLVIDNNGKITVHGERNPHLFFENATKNQGGN